MNNAMGVDENVNVDDSPLSKVMLESNSTNGSRHRQNHNHNHPCPGTTCGESRLKQQFHSNIININNSNNNNHNNNHHNTINTPSTTPSPKLKRTASDPIQFKFGRSDSEIRLCQAEEEAYLIDYCMFVRIANGMWARKEDFGFEIEQCLDRVVRTRYARYTMSGNEDFEQHVMLDDYDDDEPHLVDKTRTLQTESYTRASGDWMVGDDSMCSRPLPSLVDLIGCNTTSHAIESSWDEDIFTLDL